MGKVYSIYNYLPERYIEPIRIINNGRLPYANFLSEEKALSEAKDVVEQIDNFRNLLELK